jgi:hypothetical protein
VSASEFAFLALGLLLGSASGAALSIVFRSRPPSREVRLTVTHSAVPTRASTLSSDAFVTRPAQPAPGGPGDRREVDREGDSGGIDRRSGGGPGPRSATPLHDRRLGDSRTPVRSGPGVAVAIHPEPDRALESMRTRRPSGPAVDRILRGDHRAMLDALDAIAGDDGPRRRTWEALLTGLTEALTERAIDLGVLDFPLGTAFWDTFTIDQCRQISASLASMGYRFDGGGGWVGGRAPSYRDLSRAVAEAGFDTRRIRAWPNQMEIAELYRGARPAPADAVSRWAPSLDLDAIRELLGPRVEAVGELWLAWESLRRVLLEPAPITSA